MKARVEVNVKAYSCVFIVVHEYVRVADRCVYAGRDFHTAISNHA